MAALRHAMQRMLHPNNPQWPNKGDAVPKSNYFRISGAADISIQLPVEKQVAVTEHSSRAVQPVAALQSEYSLFFREPEIQ